MIPAKSTTQAPAQAATQPPAPATRKPRPTPVRLTDWASI